MSLKKRSRPWNLAIQDMIDHCESIIEYTQNIDFEYFQKNSLVFHATFRCFEVIGEATILVTEDIQVKYPEISWQKIKNFRNLLIHEYFGIDKRVVFETAKNKIPELLELLLVIKTKENI